VGQKQRVLLLTGEAPGRARGATVRSLVIDLSKNSSERRIFSNKS